MSSREGRGAVLARGMCAAGIATFAVTVSHATAAGAIPSAWAVVVAFAVAAMVCVGLAGRRLSWWRLSTAVAASQAFFHLLLSVGFGDPLPGSPESAVGHAHHALISLTPAPEALMGGGGASAAMWSAHLVAAVVTVLALGSGERAAGAIVWFLAASFRALAPVGVMPSLPARAVVVSVERVAVLRGFLSTVRRRGPPFAA